MNEFARFLITTLVEESINSPTLEVLACAVTKHNQLAVQIAARENCSTVTELDIRLAVGNLGLSIRECNTTDKSFHVLSTSPNGETVKIDPAIVQRVMRGIPAAQPPACII